MDYLPINIGLLKHPLNWLIVFFMVVLVLIPLSMIHDRFVASQT